jgi:hypothetical protein
MREAVSTNGISPKKSASVAVLLSDDHSGEEQTSKKAQLMVCK